MIWHFYIFIFLNLKIFKFANVNFACPKLKDLKNGGFICADDTRQDVNSTLYFYDIRVCAPNCRTGYVSNIKNCIFFCTSKSKTWKMLPETNDYNKLACVPTINMLYFT